VNIKTGALRKGWGQREIKIGAELTEVLSHDKG